jgi:hypothetical protein
MSPTVVATWSASYSRAAGFVIPDPVTKSVGVNVANSGAEGNWLIAIVGWRQPLAAPVNPTTFAVGDDVGNVWEPLGAPNGTSSAAGVTRAAIWVCPNVSQIAAVFASPNGNHAAAGLLVLEVAGMSSWITTGSVQTAFTVAGFLTAFMDAYPPTGAPLNANYLFGSTTAPWTAKGCTIAASTAWGYQTPGSLALTPSGTATAPSAASEMVPVSAGTMYTMSFWALSPAAWNGAQAVINWFNSSGTFLSSTGGTAVPTLPGQFAYVFASADAPAGAAFATGIVHWTGTPPATAVLYASQVMIGAASQVLAITACASDIVGNIQPPGGSGWTGLPTVSNSNGVDETSDIVLSSAYQVTSGLSVANWGALAFDMDFGAVTACLLVQGVPPVAPQQSWPLIRVQLGLGAGAQTPWDEIGWTEITARYRGMNGSRGKQYELDTIQAGTHNWTLSNNDGWLTPENQASPYYPFVQVYTPVRMLATWPPPPAAFAKTYGVVRHFMERWPQSRTTARYQNAAAVSTDVWALLTPEQVTIARSEILSDDPYGVWPCDDPAGSSTARNIAPAGAGPLQVVTSKYGAGTSVQAFQSGSGVLPGDPDGANWSLADVPAGETQGTTLYYFDTNLPPVPAGVSLDGWFIISGAQPTGVKLALMTVRNPQGNLWQLYVQQSTGHILIDITVSGSTTTTTVSTTNWITQAAYFHAAVTFDENTWQVWINGGSFGAASGFSGWTIHRWWFSFNGTADRIGVGQFYNGSAGMLAVYPLRLSQARAVAHYWSALTGLQDEDGPGIRIERLMGASQCAFPRALNTPGYALQGALDIAQQAVSQNVTNIAESDNGLLVVNGAGYVRYASRANMWNLPVLWTFGEDVAPPLNANWDFEASTAPWAGQNNAVLSRSAVWSRAGEFSAMFTPDGVTASPQMGSESIPAARGVFYTGSAWLYSVQGWATGVAVSIRFHNSAGALVSTFTSPVTPLGAGQPVMLTITGQAPETAVTANLVIFGSGTPASSVQFLADLAIFGATATEYPYLPDFVTDHDPSQVFNDVELDQEQAPALVGADATGVTITLASAASIAQFGDQTLQETIYTTAVQGIIDLAAWIVNTMGAPQTRIANMTLDPSANPALWPVVLSLESGQVIWVNARLIDQEDVSGPFQIMTISHANTPGDWKTTVTAVPYNGYVLTCDDPANGVLDGQPRLAW